MFATHYHSLVEEYVEDNRVSLGHMGCIVDPENDRKVTFLYKLEDACAPRATVSTWRCWPSCRKK
ncbi:P-loop containing nucleoside triphosphate hydrolase [Phytophthora cactorum]|nr:P-loop containing nucleoside triphosphate hydrolase [Phytophthora cactorum]